ncbi:hypothetical protein C7534_101562 [Pseudomonas sp. OV226]|nr:hypothetical protein C7534_101562 [Pseudomonas sp. OV226]
MPLMFISHYFGYRCVVRHDDSVAIEGLTELLGQPSEGIVIPADEVGRAQPAIVFSSANDTKIIHPIPCCLGSRSHVFSRGKISPASGAKEPRLIPNKGLVFQDVNVRQGGVPHLVEGVIYVSSIKLMISTHVNYRAIKRLIRPLHSPSFQVYVTGQDHQVIAIG